MFNVYSLDILEHICFCYTMNAVLLLLLYNMKNKTDLKKASIGVIAARHQTAQPRRTTAADDRNIVRAVKTTISQDYYLSLYYSSTKLCVVTGISGEGTGFHVNQNQYQLTGQTRWGYHHLSLLMTSLMMVAARLNSDVYFINLQRHLQFRVCLVR